MINATDNVRTAEERFLTGLGDAGCREFAAFLAGYRPAAFRETVERWQSTHPSPVADQREVPAASSADERIDFVSNMVEDEWLRVLLYIAEHHGDVLDRAQRMT